MCRFVAYLGPPLRLSLLVTEPTKSLIHQSAHARERTEPLNGDGFGVAWYTPAQTQAGIFRSITPAWNNRNLHELAPVVESHYIFAHVRAASQALDVSEVNCHPFVHQGHTLMHNGDIGGFRRIRRPLLTGLSDHVGSEPLSEDPGWTTVEAGEMVVVDPERRVIRQPFIPVSPP